MAEGPVSKRIPLAEIEAGLDRVLRSNTFARSERSRELLRYLVEQELAGNADRLKGFGIALDVFGRDAGFDPSTDAVVRVQAGRLRDMLENYYEKEGARDRVRITIPRGSYVPFYREIDIEPVADGTGDPAEAPATLDATSATSGALAEDTPSEARSSAGTRPSARTDSGLLARNLRGYWMALAGIGFLLIVIIALLLGTYIAYPPADDGPERDVTASTALPSVGFVREGGMDGEEAVVEIVEDALPRFESVNFVGPTGGAEVPASDFFLRLFAPGTGEARLQLFHRETGILITGDDLSLGADRGALERQLAASLSRMVPVSGTLYAYLQSEDLLNRVTRCLVLAGEYFNRQSEERHEQAMKCDEVLIDDGVALAPIYSDAASLEIEALSDAYDYPPDANIERALERARRAIELSPLSAYAYRALNRVLLRAGEEAAALEAIGQAHDLNPYDLSIAASYGNNLVRAGEFAEAADVLSRAIEASPAHPTWWDYAYFIAAFLDGRKDEAADAAGSLIGHDRPHYLAVLLLAADIRGNEAQRQELIEELQGRDSTVVRNPVAFWSRTLPQNAAERLADALADAGLSTGPRDGG